MPPSLSLPESSFRVVRCFGFGFTVVVVFFSGSDEAPVRDDVLCTEGYEDYKHKLARRLQTARGANQKDKEGISII